MRRALFILAVSLTPAALPVLATEAAAQPAPAKAGPGTTAVQTANNKISAQLKAKAPAAQVIASVQGFIDINELGKRAMVNQWSKLKPNEQTDFLKVLNELIEANYINAQQANVNYTVDYLGEAPNAANDLVVNTAIKAQRKGRPFTMKIDYVMIKKGASYQAVDVITDGVGLVDNYKSTFDKIMKDKGFAGLMTTMNNKLAAIKAAAPAGAGSAAPAAGSAAPAKSPPKKT